MRIGIISDTHKKAKRAEMALNVLVQDGAEFIIHAGDIVEVETLELLKNCGLRYVAVYGNNDAHLAHYHNDYNLVQEPHYFKLADTKFKLMHLPYYMAPDTDVVIFGHTHEFESDFKNGTLFLNPGECCARNKPVSEFAMLEVSSDNFSVTYYTREKKEKNFRHQKFLYERART
ncbi:MAG: YfcE family phosphodiesterase [Sulfurimonas sp.]|uniref:metallophosphoesterase family protein n=1 Tax=Sulfurimonas sp. TaxID=2022749 RepID=UPI00262C837B|nr:YfcE family phosphodiesterase [Sulfurimonas sp.]MCW8896232.1 YfcE family phosphodiesterase [Sulfurimonas sp.]MCW8954507.1 YfcE family phosphodiesterase [Sulfurimonas sp.]